MTCGRLYGGVLLTVAAAGFFLSVVGVAEVGLRVFSSALVVAAVSAALWCRDWRCPPRRFSPCFSWRRRLGVMLCGLFDFFQGLLYLFFYFFDGFWWGCGG